MAEISVANAVDALLRKAQSLARESIFSGVMVAQMKNLIRYGEQAVGIIPDAEKKAMISSSDWEPWLEQINGVVSEGDDMLDDCVYHLHHFSLELSNEKKPKDKVRNYFCLVGSSSMRSNMIRKFRIINETLEDVLNKEILLGSSSAIESQGVQDQNIDAPKVSVQEMIESSSAIESRAVQEVAVQKMIDSSAIELQVAQENNDVKKIVDELLDSGNDKDLSFISLVGWGGVGKSTLAQLVYKHVGVTYHFDERMWVRVPLDFDNDGILKRMLTNLTSNRMEGQTTKEVIFRRLQERMKGKRYLLVLDDIWEENITKWKSLIKFLLNLGGSRGSKVVITTCVEDVARSVQSSLTHQLSLKTDDYCWNLFEKIAFAEGGAIKTPRLEGVGRNLVKQCRGNPLYIKLLGSLMYNMRDEAQWLTIQKSERWEDLSLGIPKLCCDYMPIPLKQCFRYCLIFPKDYVIPREELIQLWMAQGFLNPPKGSDSKMEEVGAHYHDILLRSSFFQVAEDDDFERKSCKMHDLLRGLALSTVPRGYFNTLKEITEFRDPFDAVHLSLINCCVNVPKSLRDSFSKLRTLHLENARGFGDILKCAEDLRVLIVVDGSVEELPSSIGMLRRLKYLDISRTNIVRLPDSISKLYHLQTLRLYDLQDSPKNFENLVSLRHFYVENFKDSAQMNILPTKFRGLVNLSSTKAFLNNDCKIDNLEVWEHPDKYSSLSIYRLENVTHGEQAKKAKLSMMSRIESLKLHWNARRGNYYDEDVLEVLKPHTNLKNLAIENFKGSKFPSWMVKPDSQILNNLVKMELENCSWCEQLPPLGHLPHLKTVKILGMDNVKCIGIEFYGFISFDGTGTDTAFRALKELTIFGMASLEQWAGAEQLSNSPSTKAFPFLQTFELEQCPKLISIPDHLVSDSNHKYLRRLRIALCEKLNHLPKGLGKLESLEDLEIRGLPSLDPSSIGCGNNLRTLTIGCFSTASEDNCQKQHAIDSQTSVHLKGGNVEVKSLPEQLQNLSALRNLTIWGYGGLETLPDWLANLRSLQVLKLELCGRLMRFPSAEKMQQLTSLKELNICYCPLLEERCTRGSRPEWYKVSRIPTIIVNYETIYQLSQP